MEARRRAEREKRHKTETAWPMCVAGQLLGRETALLLWQCVLFYQPESRGPGQHQQCERCSRTSGDQGLNHSALIQG